MCRCIVYVFFHYLKIEKLTMKIAFVPRAIHHRLILCQCLSIANLQLVVGLPICSIANQRSAHGRFTALLRNARQGLSIVTPQQKVLLLKNFATNSQKIILFKKTVYVMVPDMLKNDLGIEVALFVVTWLILELLTCHYFFLGLKFLGWWISIKLFEITRQSFKKNIWWKVVFEHLPWR